MYNHYTHNAISKRRIIVRGSHPPHVGEGHCRLTAFRFSSFPCKTLYCFFGIHPLAWRDKVVSLTVYDGAYGIGGNKLYLEENGNGIFLDFGKNIGKYGVFYEEFLKNRDRRGIHDLIHLDLLPKLNIYRPDLIPAIYP